MVSPVSFISNYFRPLPEQPPLEDQAIVTRLYRRWRWSAFLSITLGYAFFYTTRLSFSVAKPGLLDSGVLDANQMGKIGFALLIAYAAGKFANGFLADHVNPSRFFSTGLLLSALTNLIFGLTDSYLLFIILWSINGWLQSMGAPTSGVVMSKWFSNSERGTRYAVWCTSHNIGEAITFVFTSILVAHMGWRWGFLGPGVACLAVALLLFYTIPDRPRSLGLPRVNEYRNDHTNLVVDDHLPIRQLQKEVLKNGRVWILALSSALMYVSRYGINHWGVLYLKLEKHYSEVEAGVVVSLFPLVGIAGSASSGMISDRFFGARRSPVTLAYGLLFVLSLCFLYLIPVGNPWVVRLAISAAGFAIGGLLVFLGGLTAMDICSKRASGAALGLVGGVSYVGAAIQDWVSGALLEGGARTVERVVENTGALETITIYDFSTVKYVWIGAAMLSLLLALTLWRSEGKKSRREG